MNPPRGEQREDAVLRATLELLAEIGYGSLTMDAVAARAKASKATIYRRWSGKAQLVTAAIERHTAAADHPAPDTGTLRGDLLGLLRPMRDRLTDESAALVLGLLTAMRDDATLAAAVRARLIGVKRDAFAPALRRAAGRGEIAGEPEHGLIAEVASALLFSRLFVTGEPLDDAFLDRLADAVILPLLHGATP
ncbi:TetR/AcrR family transcriptional regulator [Jiangella sp. DSM 45060]|uniref:TetR/AcrR family transcriptional regulator n=1 Tax=Jiangella sp. DSM 45060 TaxID=1798224 RepID=UPI00087B6FF9|nr:TetR/AcrR family transcriptional regulator [Jiangella sp. DSM 45060]SDS22875.1 DNA-binding transcriptional regulator, AcrR family [Jiangella sp. DSM 45060]